jgi:predicted RNase H-like nuclease (RuvC/YqgF family)
VDPTVVAALVAAGLGVGGVGGQFVAHWLGRDHRKAQTDLIRQDIYQQLTKDLKDELDRLRTSLRETSAEAEQLRSRVLDLESRVAQLTRAEAHASEELQRVERERDQLRADLAARNATIAELRSQVTTLTLQASLAQSPPTY